MSRVGVVDYDAGNLKSVETALNFLDADFLISSDPMVLLDTDKLIFPGVGEAGAAMESLGRYGLDSALQEYYASGRYILGICIGAQIILSKSEETEAECLNLIDGKAKRFPGTMGLKVPHMGWNGVEQIGENSLFKDIPGGSSFYFVHSYYPVPSQDDIVIGKTEYGIEFCSALQKDNLLAVQFHPEKSGKWGLQLLHNFLAEIGPDCIKEKS